MDHNAILLMHRRFSETLYDLHKHGDAILNALTEHKGRKALRKDPLRTIYKTVLETCDYTNERTKTSELKHQLDGLLFFQAADHIDHVVLAEVYYNRSAWMTSYTNPPPSQPIFDKTEDLSEPDVAYMCNYCHIYLGHINDILTEVLNFCENEPLYSYRHVLRALVRIVKEQEQMIERLYAMLSEHMNKV